MSWHLPSERRSSDGEHAGTANGWRRTGPPRAERRFNLAEGQQEMLTGPVAGAAEPLSVRARLANLGRLAPIWGPARWRLLSQFRGERKHAF